VTQDRLQTVAGRDGYPLHAYDWSEDGKWLLLVDAGVLRALAPATGLAVDLVPPVPGCAFAAWVRSP
jgi:hypothetical protein